MRKPLLFTILVLTLIVNSCSLSKNWIYLQDMVPGEQYPVDIRYEAKIMRDDRLRITVASKNPELALPFNIHSGSFRVGEDGSIAAYQNDVSRQEDGYRVDVDGNIDFPILGKLHVAGLLDELGAGHMAHGALGGGILSLIDITAHRADPFFHRERFLP